ncbi:MAG: hypothetical protein ACUVWZ_08080 [Anaerolineae bacterium]
MSYLKYDLTSLHSFLGDFVVYRNLIPADERLPSFPELVVPLGLPDRLLPRKAEPAFGRVVAEILRQARKIDLPRTGLRRLVYLGDTRMNDGTAFHNLCLAGDWPGWAFIAQENMTNPPRVEIEGSLYLTNRWSAVLDFLHFLEQQDFVLDEETAVVIDMDKTAIGAKGRNDRAIDEARVESIQYTVAELLGPDFDQQTFGAAYAELKQPAYHPFTADNQDYLAYICLMIGAGLFQLDTLTSEIRAGTMPHFINFINQVESRRSELAGTGLASVHDAVWQCVQAGDPTPFKAFRYNEYLATAARFGDLPDGTIEQLLAKRIVITQEVREAAIILRSQGALLFGLSDKPDEASVPTAAQAERGMKPLHRLETVAVGSL